MRISCPHCYKSIGGPATDGGQRVRLGIVLIEDDGRIHGPCPHCKSDVTIADNAQLSKALRPAVIPAVRLKRRRRS